MRTLRHIDYTSAAHVISLQHVSCFPKPLSEEENTKHLIYPKYHLKVKFRFLPIRNSHFQIMEEKYTAQNNFISK